NEMRERIERLIGPHLAPSWVGTFHAISARILRREAENLGVRRDFVIYDADDQLALIKKVMKGLNLSDKRFAPEAVRSYISRAKDQLIGPEEYAGRGGDFFERHVARVYTAYQQALVTNNALDFDDLIMQVADGFERVPSMLERYQERFQYILVDEYQDTNHAQYVLINRLAQRYRNLCVVGDDDQSIYAWRGADIMNILDFEKDYPEAMVVRLEQNYRSTQLILAAGNAVIRHNKGRKGKELWTHNAPGDRLTVIETLDERDEARMVARKAQDEVAQSDRRLRDIVVLYRTNAQSRALEDELRKAGLPHVIVGGLRFFERKEVKDVIAYLKVVANPRDSISFRRIVNTPSRGIGDASLDKLEAFALAEGLTLIEALLRADEAGLTPAARKTAQGLGQFLTELHHQHETWTVADVAKRIVEETGYLRDLELEAARSPDAEMRAQNVKELLAATEEFTDRVESPSTRTFLEEAALVTDFDRWDETMDRLTLMTLHNAKGLEFPVVFITGLEDGLFPIARTMESRDDLEEERRLFYVGITRAKERLYLSYATLRRRFGGVMPGIRSRFVDEVPDDLVEHNSTVRRTGGRRAMLVPDVEDEDDGWDGALRLTVGQRIRHPVWGVGRVLELSGTGDDLRATIRFDSATKKVMVRYAGLEAL
ncbi:MAG: UvrD-helicase domain-containing protein, partial [Candidatus Latescibacteria bacterium]|nr:UvrD-helicase domain-containing protein [Candidatus Latescibacterota bacterium]